MTHELTPTEYLYRGHYITRRHSDPVWTIADPFGGPVLYSSPSIDDCIAMIDGVMDEVES